MAELGHWKLDNLAVRTGNLPYPYMLPSVHKENPRAGVQSHHSARDRDGRKDTLLRLLIVDDNLKPPPYYLAPPRFPLIPIAYRPRHYVYS